MAPLSEAVLDMIKSLRRNWHSLCPSERTTVCGADFMLEALQLSMAEINKQHSGEFTVSLSDVLVAWKHLLHEKLDLPFEDMEVVEHYKDIRKTYDSFLKNSNILDLIDVYQKCQTLTSTCENKVMSPVQLLDFISGRSCISYENINLSGSESPASKCNLDNKKVQSIARKIICSYLSLLVNSKNDLALAHIINVPDRGLGREAFTDLKHAAQEKQMSVFLVATSFIRMIELGGKGYAPSPSDPLRTHGKGLNNFIIFMDKLEEILGEIPNPRMAGGRILSAIKTELIKGRSSGDPFRQATEEVTQDLDLRIKNIINSQQEDRVVNTTGSSPARPKSYAINHGTAYCGRETVKILLVLLDEEASNPPTENKADLLYGEENTTSYTGTPILTLFSSPTQANEFLIKPLRERVQKSMEEKRIKMKQTLIRSQFACTYKEDFMTSHERCSWRNQTEDEPACTPHLQNALTEGTDSFDGVPTLGTNSGNVQLNRSKNERLSKKSSGQTGNKGPKRKQVDLNGDNGLCDHENELSRLQMSKIPKSSSNLQSKSNQILARSAVKGCKPATKNKLIAGQTKLTQFFRL
ncbi:PCNA-interacting partner isoform X1 [Vombatus ursinus]|uniref:PCNA-interacting partner n=1 Tax=Vombatus ursinus TaxID=29139 RepID=A0A4X2MA94_VOMUR|nr:PCNA-interacting partner isoform X1 [Vombatus ursinus]